MRVARCRPQPTDVPQGQAGSELGKRRGGTPIRPPPVTSDVLRALGEVLEEVELLGGGNVAAITNEPALAALLQVSVGIVAGCFCLTLDDVCDIRSGKCVQQAGADPAGRCIKVMLREMACCLEETTYYATQSAMVCGMHEFDYRLY